MKIFELNPLPPSFIGSTVIAWMIVMPARFIFTIGIGSNAPAPTLTSVFILFALPLTFALLFGLGMRVTFDEIDRTVRSPMSSCAYSRIDKILLTKRLFFLTVQIKPRGSRSGFIMSFPRSHTEAVENELKRRMPGALLVRRTGILRTTAIPIISLVAAGIPFARSMIASSQPQAKMAIKRIVLDAQENFDWLQFSNDQVSFRLPSPAKMESDSKGKVSFESLDPRDQFVLETDLNPDYQWIDKIFKDNHLVKMPINEFYDYIFNSPVGFIPLTLKVLIIKEVFKNGQIYEVSHPIYHGYAVPMTDGGVCRTFIGITTVSGNEISMILTTARCNMNLLKSFLSSVSYSKSQQ